ncbi:MAG: DUF285 domain-containing protein [Acetatifactor sp.]|nr:DUF285 domain-containing protein [Acetatifactor sp.]
MDRKRLAKSRIKDQIGKQIMAGRKALAWVLSMALVSGNICVLEGRLSVQAAESAQTAVEDTLAVAEKAGQKAVPEQKGTGDAADVSDGDSGIGEQVVAKQALFSASDDDIAGGTYKNITWRIDADGKLTVEGTGEFSISTWRDRAPWYSQRKNIKSAVVCVTGLCNISYMFYECSNLKSVDVSSFNTDCVTDMSSMFYGCSSLKSVDMSGWDTSRVTNMYSMFSGCSGLTSVDEGC